MISEVDMKRLRRCRHCGIRVPREEMRHDQLACSEECANEIWIKQQSETVAECCDCLPGEELESHVLAS
jgi:hypothetical protein